jgi:hypothetical protein
VQIKKLAEAGFRLGLFACWADPLTLKREKIYVSETAGCL